MSINLYFRKPPAGFKWIPGDRHIIDLLRKLFGIKKASGVEKVFSMLCKGFDELKINYTVNKAFKKIKANEPVIVLGAGKYSLAGYHQPNPIIAGIGLMTHPSEWPTLFEEYPVIKYLQHSEWANNVYAPYYGAEACDLWPAGIDTEKWQPVSNAHKETDFLIYNKIRWNNRQIDSELRLPLLKKLDELGLSYREIKYGFYNEKQYYGLLNSSSAMIFLCEHESQGFACCEALAMNVPVLAWNQGYCLDPNRFAWNDPVIPATSIPFFNSRCGSSFKNTEDFYTVIDPFWNKVKSGKFHPRKYVLENLTLKISANRMLEIINEVYK